MVTCTQPEQPSRCLHEPDGNEVSGATSAVSTIIAVAPLQLRFPTHGGMTSAAPGAQGSLAGGKATFAIHNRIWSTRRAEASAPRGCGNAIARAFAKAPVTVCGMVAVAPLQVRQRDPWRADVRRSWCTTFVGRQKSDFCDTQSHMVEPKSGGVSPPWSVKRAANGDIAPMLLRSSCAGSGAGT